MFDDERRARLLQFVTGSFRVPIDGFKALRGQFLKHFIWSIPHEMMMIMNNKKKKKKNNNNHKTSSPWSVTLS